jgi:hydrogenase nickel incorporation protein HypB
MCRDCGCGDPEIVPIEVQEKILAGNDRVALHNREHFIASGVLAINLMGSPGAGKTAVLERTAAAFKERFRLGAITADLATDNDAARLKAAGIPSRAITTGTACHLDARLVHDALHDFPTEEFGLLFIENVGNLVCPAVYDLGQAYNVVALSVTEGEDKPLKYPTMFLKADLVLITKTDLVPHLEIDVAKIHDALAHVMPEPKAFELSAKSGAGFTAWLDWLEARRGEIVAKTGQAHAHDHAHHH